MKFHRVRYIDFATVFFYFMKVPMIIFKKIRCIVLKEDYDKFKELLRIINEVRIEVNNYQEKDSQSRTTFKAYYAYNDNYIKIRCRFIKKSNENQYIQFKDSVQAHTGQKCSGIRFYKGYCYFTIYLDFEPLNDFESDNISVSFGTSVYGLKKWDWVEYPHLLCTGETGQGKSVFMRYLLSGLFSANHEVWCIDGKCIDYALVKGMFKYYVANDTADKENIMNLVRCFCEKMHKRYEEMAEKGISSYIEDENYRPVFLLIDEYLTICKQLTKKEKEKFDHDISDIILLGRACGYILIVTMQRADAKYISGDMRDNFMFRAVLGKASKANYKMMFENDVQSFDEKGWAWYMLGTDLGIVRIPYFKTITRSCEKI